MSVGVWMLVACVSDWVSACTCPCSCVTLNVCACLSACVTLLRVEEVKQEGGVLRWVEGVELSNISMDKSTRTRLQGQNVNTEIPKMLLINIWPFKTRHLHNL